MLRAIWLCHLGRDRFLREIQLAARLLHLHALGLTLVTADERLLQSSEFLVMPNA